MKHRSKDKFETRPATKEDLAYIREHQDRFIQFSHNPHYDNDEEDAP